MNRKTKALITLIASIIAFITLTINTFMGTNIELSPEIVQSIATLLAVAIMWAISHYYNQDYSGIAGKFTPIMRKIKVLEKEGDLRLLDQIELLIDTWEDDDDEYDD